MPKLTIYWLVTLHNPCGLSVPNKISVLMLNTKKNTTFNILWGDLLAGFLEGLIQFTVAEKKLSIGKRLLPASLRKNRNIVVAANCGIWISVMVMIVLVVKRLS